MLFRTQRKGQHLGVPVSADGVANSHPHGQGNKVPSIKTTTISYPAFFLASLKSSLFRLPAHCLLLFGFALLVCW